MVSVFNGVCFRFMVRSWVIPIEFSLTSCLPYSKEATYSIMTAGRFLYAVQVSCDSVEFLLNVFCTLSLFIVESVCNNFLCWAVVSAVSCRVYHTLSASCLVCCNIFRVSPPPKPKKIMCSQLQPVEKSKDGDNFKYLVFISRCVV